MQAVFIGLIEDQMRRWMALADERLAGSAVRCYIMPGNDDDPCIDPIIAAARHVCNPDGQAVEIGLGYTMISGGFSNATPWQSVRELSEEQIASLIDTMLSGVADLRRAIFNLHIPPHSSGIDTVQKLDEALRPVYRNGHPVYIPAGSTAVRAAIQRYQPVLALHGHIHESKGTFKLGRTLCINPGSEYASGRLHGVLVDMDDKRVVSHLFTTG
jgi:Icc-related predicted phosphoesterase